MAGQVRAAASGAKSYAQEVLELLTARVRLVFGHERSRDANARDLDDEALAWGASIVKLGDAGDGIPDRLLGVQGIDQLCEYKNPEGKNRLAANQDVFAKLWRGRPRRVVRTREEMRHLVGELRAEAVRIRATAPAAA